ncbi:MAG TPA: hypothetical protein VGN07_15825 [Steroidobacteraceae bacterium]|jgi:NAD+ synthase (glutamine-hydrolysing)
MPRKLWHWRGRGCAVVDLMIFPEWGLSAYAVDDLLLQDALLAKVEASIAEILAASGAPRLVPVVGAPSLQERQQSERAI